MRKLWLIFAIITFISCKKDASNSLHFNQILILGNSITIHPPAPSIGWFGNWGMAASSRDKDFAHIIGATLNTRVDPVNLSEWEALGMRYDLTKLIPYFKSKPDLVIIRMGENINDIANLKMALGVLIDYIKIQNPKARLIITGRFWRNDEIDDILSLHAMESNIPFVKLNQLELGENVSFIGANIIGEDGLSHPIIDQGIANHPGDLGMRRIADCILAEIYKMK